MIALAARWVLPWALLGGLALAMGTKRKVRAAEVAPSPLTTLNKVAFLEKVNQLRLRGCLCGVKPKKRTHALRWNDTLEQAAFAHARDMIKRGYFNHRSPEGEYPWDRAEKKGYSSRHVGENIAMCGSQEVAFRLLRESASHCDNMMGNVYSEVGIARYNNIWVMVLGG